MAEHKHWSAHVSALETEGISVQAYARRERLSAALLYRWRKRLSAAARQDQQPVAQWVALQLPEQPDADQRCTLWLASGVRLELSALPPARWLAQVAGATSPQVR